MDPDVSDAETQFCGGWTSCDNSKHYMNKSPAVLQARGICLEGYSNCQACVYWPQLDSVICHNQDIDNKYLFHFVKMLISLNLTCFQEGMELWPLWQTMVASLLMYHFDVALAYGPTNAIVSQVLEIAQLI